MSGRRSNLAGAVIVCALVMMTAGADAADRVVLGEYFTNDG